MENHSKSGDRTPLRKSSGHFATLTLIMALLLLGAIGAGIVEGVRQPGPDRLQRFVLRIISMLPAVFYLWALQALYTTFRDIARGSLFEPAMARGLRQLGWSLLASGVVSTFLVPLLSILFIKSGIGDTVISDTHEVRIDAAYLMLVLVGTAILLLSRLFGMAGHYRAQSVALRSELDEFL